MEALLAESRRVGWPEHYRTDLEHDAVLLEGWPCPQFGWGLRQCGTDLFLPLDTLLVPHWTHCGARTPREWAIRWAKAVVKYSPDTLLYWWNGLALRRVSLPTLIERLEINYEQPVLPPVARSQCPG
jgi:hypothetical protein